MQKSMKFNIDLNARDNSGYTAFHCACLEGHPKIAEMLILKSTEVNIDLNAVTNSGKTAFHLAYFWKVHNIVEIMMKYAEAFKIDCTKYLLR